jgi:Acyl-CoA carboxylase epsilon subunit
MVHPPEQDAVAVPGTPLLQVVRGVPDETELAAVAVVLTIISGRGESSEGPGGGPSTNRAHWRHRRGPRPTISWAANT